MTATDLVRPAPEGTVFQGPGLDAGHSYVVAPACSGNTHNGRWFCITHGESFGNQLQKDFHIHHGSHLMTWICLEHGPEVP